MSNPSRYRAVWSVITGVLLGSALTLCTLRAVGVPLTPGLMNPELKKFYNVYSDLASHYYRPVSQSTLIEGAINGMTKSLDDPFTDYFSPTQATAFQNTLSGSFNGIGVLVGRNGSQLVVDDVFPGSPAQRAGLKPKDIIVSVNGVNISTMPMDQASNLILGPAGTKVVLLVRRPTRPGTVLKITAVRSKIAAPSVFSHMYPHRVGYIQVTIVGDHSGSDFDKQLQSVIRAGARSLVIDLRGNPGGYLDQALSIADDLIPKGKVVIEQQRRGSAPKATRSTGPGVTLPIIVLIDQNTASAAEVLAAALHDDTGAPLVGTKSFGKGTAQDLQLYSDGSELKYTTEKWLTPTGDWIHGKGIQPTVHVNLPTFVTYADLVDAAYPLKLGQNSKDVADLQKYLVALGYQVDRTDGYFDASTRQAVVRFQNTVHLQPSGVVDSSTAGRLQTALDDLIAKSDTQLKTAVDIATARAMY